MKTENYFNELYHPYNMEVELKQWGHSTRIVIPSEKLKELGLKKGDKIHIDIIKKRINGFGMCKGSKPFKEEKEKHNKFW